MIRIFRGVNSDNLADLVTTPPDPGQRRTLGIVIKQAYVFTLARVMRGNVGGDRCFAASALGVCYYNSLKAHSSNTRSELFYFQKYPHIFALFF